MARSTLSSPDTDTGAAYHTAYGDTFEAPAGFTETRGCAGRRSAHGPGPDHRRLRAPAGGARLSRHQPSIVVPLAEPVRQRPLGALQPRARARSDRASRLQPASL